MKKKAFITGISGMDGENLSKHLLSLDYEVHGTIRRHSVSESQESRISDVKGIQTYYADMSETTVLEKLLREIQPDEIYHLAAMSHVKVSWDIPAFTLNTNGCGTLNLLEAYRNNSPKSKFYFAASSECFGLTVDENGYQNENTIMNPTSVYGCSKVLGYNLTRHYRRAYGLHACCGILFNHTGIGRGSNFAEAKIVKTACMIKLGLADKLELGNLDSYRDFGASKDYVKGMVKILNHHAADDFVLATGKTYSMRQVCEIVFSYLDMDYRDYVIQNPKYLRPEELPYLIGDSSKARREVNWEPEYTFEKIVREMCDHWIDKLANESKIVLKDKLFGA